MDSEDKFLLIIISMVLTAIVLVISAGVTDDIMTHNTRPDMSKCELMSNHEASDFWYECPTSVGK